MVTRVDIAGYFLVFATLRERRHVVFLLGATSFPRTIEHDPDSFQVFLPVDTLVRRRDKDVDDFFATSLFLMVKPGRAESDKDVSATCPVSDDVLIAKLYFTPFSNPSTTHEVCAVRHTTLPSPEVTTYVTFAVDTTAPHDNEIDLFRESDVAVAGASGFPSGVPVVATAEVVPKALAPTTDMEYSVPFVRPVIVHDVVVVEHVSPPGVAVAV
jgi:hypothetical protein